MKNWICTEESYTMSAPGEMQERELGLVSTDEKLQKLQYDLCLALDVTASMTDELDAARNTLLETVERCRQKYKEYDFRLGIVFYRDYMDRVRFVKREFTNDVESIVNAIKQETAYGGGDVAEDLTGALQQVAQMDWRGDKRQLVVVCDAPCHGRQYHDGVSDYHLDGDKYGLNPEHLMTELAAKQVSVTAIQMNSSTKIMWKILDMAYQHGRVPGIKTKFILADMTEQLAQAKAEFHRKRLEEEERWAEEERRLEEEYERRLEEERRLLIEAFTAEHGELPEGFERMLRFGRREDDVERGNDRGFGDDDDDGDRVNLGIGGGIDMNSTLFKFMEMSQERLSRISREVREVPLPSLSLTESPSDGVFSDIIMTAVSSQLD